MQRIIYSGAQEDRFKYESFKKFVERFDHHVITDTIASSNHSSSGFAIFFLNDYKLAVRYNLTELASDKIGAMVTLFGSEEKISELERTIKESS